MHLLQLYKLFPFQEDLHEYLDEAIWSDWKKTDSLQRGLKNAIENTLLAEPGLDPQQWLLALHLQITLADRNDKTLLMRELNIDEKMAQKVLVLTRAALAAHPVFYAKLAKSLGSCVSCG